MVAVTTPLCKRLSFLPVMLTRREKCNSGKKEDLITIHKFRKDTCNSLQETLYKELFVSDRLIYFRPTVPKKCCTPDSRTDISSYFLGEKSPCKFVSAESQE
jgi:hypothetical protein